MEKLRIMKQRFLMVAMMVVMIAASVNLASCSKSNSDTTPEKPDQPTSLNGTWLRTNEANQVEVALTFDSGNSVVANIEGTWFFCTVDRTASRMTLKGNQIRMDDFTDFGTFTATTLPTGVTIVFDYEMKDGMLVIRNITMSPNLGIQLAPSYGLRFDKVYSGESFIF